MRRGGFLAAGSAFLATCVPGLAQDDADPAVGAQRPSLRVLLGPGEAIATPGGFSFDGRPYRGSFMRTDDGAIVNVVDLEEYLYSVVPHEMPPSWPPAALQAQAICARSYVLQRSNPRRAYDLVPSEADQVYLGVAAESFSGRAAVDATAGQVLGYGAGFAGAAYSSCCGGHTEASSDAWGTTPVPYLRGVVCTTCSASPNYRWSTSIPLESIERAFADDLAPYGALQGVRITASDPSGRARGFELIAARGSAIVKGSTFRLGVGARVVRSLLITSLTQANATVAIEGGGLGHGVGMCQWGARGLALTGASASAITASYFPGTQLTHD